MLNRLLRPAAALALALVLGLALPRALALAPPAQELPPSQTGDAALQSAMIGGGGSLGGGGSPGPEDPSGLNEDGSIRWKQVSDWAELEYWGNICQYLQLTGDIAVGEGEHLQFFPLYTAADVQVLDMGGHHITVPAGSSLYFGGNGVTPFTLLGEGGEEGLFRMEPGGLLSLGGMDCTQTTGLLADQPEGAWLAVNQVDCAPGQLSFAQAPVVRPWYSAGGFFLAEAGISPEELEAALPAFSMEVNYLGEDIYYYAADDPAVADAIVWDAAGHAEAIASGARTTLSARAAGPILDDGVMPPDAIPVLLWPVTMDVAFLVDGAAVTEIKIAASPHSRSYSISCQYPENALPEGAEQPWPLAEAVAQMSLDEGGTWLDVPSTGKYVEPSDDLYMRFTGECLEVDDLSASYPFLVRFRMDYQGGEQTRYRLYTDTLALSPDRAPVSSSIGGSRGGAVDLLPPVLPPSVSGSSPGGNDGSGGGSQGSGPSGGSEPDDDGADSPAVTQPSPSPGAQSALTGPVPGLFLDRTQAPPGGTAPLGHDGDGAQPSPAPGTADRESGEAPDVSRQDNVSPAGPPQTPSAPGTPDSPAQEGPEPVEDGEAPSQPGAVTPPEQSGRPSAPGGPDTEADGSGQGADRALPGPGVQIALGAGITAALLAGVLLWRGKGQRKK